MIPLPLGTLVLPAASAADLAMAIAQALATALPTGFGSLQIVNGKVVIDLTQLLPMRDQTAVTAPNLGDGIAAMQAMAAGAKTRTLNSNGTLTEVDHHADGSVFRTFTYTASTDTSSRS